MSVTPIDPFLATNVRKEEFLSSIPVEDVSPEEFDDYLRGFLQLHRRLAEMYAAGYDRPTSLNARPLKDSPALRDAIRLLDVCQWIFGHLYRMNTEKATALLSVFTLLHPSTLLTMFKSPIPMIRDVTRKDGIIVDSWVEEGRTELFQLLLQRYTLAEWGRFISESVEECIGNEGTCDILELLLEGGFKPTWNVLHGAIITSKIDIINILFRHGMSLREEERPREWKTSTSPLSTALMVGNLPVVRTLLAYGADPRYIDEHGNTVVMLAVSMHVNEECLLELLHAGVDTSIRNKRDQTCLGKAIYGELSLPVIEAIIACGADLNYRDEVGNTALRYAQGSSPYFCAVRQLLLSKGATDYGSPGSPQTNRRLLYEEANEDFDAFSEQNFFTEGGW